MTTITGFVCSASREKCECCCPKSCGHKWDGPCETSEDGRASWVTCSRCGMAALDHDLWVMP